ncbi:MAG: hypothetical protein ACXV0U_03870, partial [Kineosporiaceae bacterium]
MGGAGTPTAAAAAERVVAFLRSLGHADAGSTYPGAGGAQDAAEASLAQGDPLEVRGGEVLAWLWLGPVRVEVAEVQRLAGVAAVDTCRAACFARAGYTLDAVRWAFRAGVALFGLDDDLDVVSSAVPAAVSAAVPTVVPAAAPTAVTLPTPAPAVPAPAPATVPGQA